MQGDQLARRRVIREMDASPNGLPGAENGRPYGVQGIQQKRNPSKACSKSRDGLFCYGGQSQ